MVILLFGWLWREDKGKNWLYRSRNAQLGEDNTRKRIIICLLFGPKLDSSITRIFFGWTVFNPLFQEGHTEQTAQYADAAIIHRLIQHVKKSACQQFWNLPLDTSYYLKHIYIENRLSYTTYNYFWRTPPGNRMLLMGRTPPMETTSTVSDGSHVSLEFNYDINLTWNTNLVRFASKTTTTIY